MSRYTRAAELAKKVLGTNRNLRNQEIKMNRMLPNRAQNLAETVLKTPSIRPGGLVDAARAVGRSDAVGMGAGAAILGGGALVLSQTNPSDLGKQMAQIDQPFYELMGQVQEKASDLAQIPQVYFMQVKQAYDDERQRQQELQNIQEFGDPMGAPVEVPPTIEEQAIKPVSLFMAQGGPASPQEMFESLPLPLKGGLKIALDAPSYLIDVKGSDTAFGPNGEMIGDLTDISSYLSRLPQKYNSLLEQKSKAKKMNRRNIGANIFEIPASVVYPEGSTFGDYMRENRANRAKYQKEMELTPEEMIFINAYESHFKPKKMANGGPLDMLKNRNMREIMGEQGRTISNMDRAIAAGMGSPMYDDNEPRFEDRSPENQMFSIDTAIKNLMTEYQMVVRNNEFQRAQMIADQIDQLQQQKINIQSLQTPSDEISRQLDAIR